MTAINQATTADVWSRYWRKGVAHSCSVDFSGNYSGALAEFWACQFAQMPDDATIVDLGTGNGAIPLLAKAYAEHHARLFRVHGVDAAGIDPVVTMDAGNRFDGIRFHPNTSMLALPFADRSIDLVCSQFAIEYVPWQEISTEMARVTALGGRIACVMHTTDSRVHVTTLDQLESFDVLFESGFIENATTMAALLAAADTATTRAVLQQSAEAERVRSALNTAAQTIAERIEQADVPLMLTRTIEMASQIFRSAPSIGEQRATEAMRAVERDLCDEQYRLQHLRQAALTPQDLKGIADDLRALGFDDVRCEPIDQSAGVRYGWGLTARRPR
ncbi:MAG: class I SAM-dependent methyltransferase [Lysobacteraceae bacterium]